MTRNDAKMVAEELYALMCKKGLPKVMADKVRRDNDEYLSTRQVAEMLNLCEHKVRLMTELPRRKVGRKWLYSRNGVVDYLNR